MKKDSAYSWLVMATAFVAILLTGISTYGSISVLAYIWGDKFDISTDEAAWAPSVMAAFFFLTGPIISVIIHTIGTWKTQMIGALLLIGSSVASAFATKYWHVIISYAVVEASGASILNMAAADIVAVYFDKYRDNVLTGLLTFAMVGMAACPVLLEYLFKTLSYRDAMLMRTAMLFLAVPVTFIYRGPCLDSDTSEAPTAEGALNKGYAEDVNCEQSKIADVKIQSETAKTEEPQSETSNQIDDQKYINVGITPPSKPQDTEAKKSIIKSHVHVLKDSVFVLILLYFVLVSISENTFFALAVEFTVSIGGLTLEQAALGVTLTSSSAMLGSIILWILSRWSLDRQAVSIFSTLLLGLTLIFASISKSQPTIYASLIAFGFAEGCYVSNMLPWIAGRSSDSQYFTIRISYVFFMIGVGSIIGPVIVGIFVEATHMRYTFYFLSGFPILGSLVIVPPWIGDKVGQWRNKVAKSPQKSNSGTQAVQNQSFTIT